MYEQLIKQHIDIVNQCIKALSDVGIDICDNDDFNKVLKGIRYSYAHKKYITEFMEVKADGNI